MMIISIIMMIFLFCKGGKWTTYRHMAEETVDKCVEVFDFKTKNGCVTKGLLLDGAHNWSPTLFIRLIQDFGLDNSVIRVTFFIHFIFMKFFNLLNPF